MSVYKFYDTCSLLMKVDNLFDEGVFLISSITLNELECIKTSANKDPDTKFAARKVLHLLDEKPDTYRVCIFTTNMLDYLNEKSLTITDDAKILATAYAYQLQHPEDSVTFVTNDLALKNIAWLFFAKDSVESVKEDLHDDYTGYKTVFMDDTEMANFYSNLQTNTYNLNINEYLIIRDKAGEVVETRVWTGTEYRTIAFQNFRSVWMDEVKPLKGDVYQQLAADSMAHNKISLIKGPAGSGKTYLSFGYLFSLLDRGKIDRIIVICNTVAAKNAAKLGYLPGSRDEKLLDSQIGNVLISKIAGGRMVVEQLIQEEKLLLLPMSDIRGFDTGNRSGIYISEAQNLDIELMKLALQRIGEDSICIINGDEKTQVDDIHFAGANNGMRRVSKVFRGEDIYGEVELRIIHRSRIAKIAEKM